ncbi:MAG: flagellar basal body protein [Chthoniobacteraceae bacterium]
MIDNIFNSGTYAASKQLLDASALRHEALASNLANIETPGYKRVDLAPDFAKEFAARLRSGGAATAPAIVQDADAPAQRKDGNNVVLDHELLAMNRNSAEYDALTEFVSGSLKQLRLAITGRSV